MLRGLSLGGARAWFFILLQASAAVFDVMRVRGLKAHPGERSLLSRLAACVWLYACQYLAMRKAGRGMALSQWGASESRGQIWPGILLSGRRWGRPEITVRRRAAALQLLQPPPPPHPLPLGLPTSASILDRMKWQWWIFNLWWWFHFTSLERWAHTLCYNMSYEIY